jgi:hypothetical protein
MDIVKKGKQADADAPVRDTAETISIIEIATQRVVSEVVKGVVAYMAVDTIRKIAVNRLSK